MKLKKLNYGVSELVNQEQVADPSIGTFTFNTSKLTNGNYLLNVISDGAVVYEEQIVILK